jgi:hypothetical protein
MPAFNHALVAVERSHYIIHELSFDTIGDLRRPESSRTPLVDEKAEPLAAFDRLATRMQALMFQRPRPSYRSSRILPSEGPTKAL